MRWLVYSAIWMVSVCPALAAEWQVDPQASENQVQFTSKVVGFALTGATDQVDGFVYWEGDSLFARACQVHIEVDLESLDTGIGQRDRHMREVLDTRTSPRAIFHGTVGSYTVVDTSITLYRIQVEGTMSINGTKRQLIVPGTLRMDAERWHAESTFRIRLQDYHIQAPSLAAFVKVSDQVRIDVAFALKPVDGERPVVGEEMNK